MSTVERRGGGGARTAARRAGGGACGGISACWVHCVASVTIPRNPLLQTWSGGQGRCLQPALQRRPEWLPIVRLVPCRCQQQVARPRKRATGRQRIDPGRFRLPHDSKVDRRPHGSDAAKLTPDRHRGLLRALKDAPAVAVFAMATAATQRNGWTWAVGLDNFGFDYPLRALVSGPYLGGQGEKEAMYPLRYTDSTGGCSPARRPARCISSVPRRSTPSGR